MRLYLDGRLAAVSRPAMASLRARFNTGSLAHFTIRDFLSSSPPPSLLPLHQNLNPRSLHIQQSSIQIHHSLSSSFKSLVTFTYPLLHFTSSSHFARCLPTVTPSLLPPLPLLPRRPLPVVVARSLSKPGLTHTIFLPQSNALSMAARRTAT